MRNKSSIHTQWRWGAAAGGCARLPDGQTLGWAGPRGTFLYTQREDEAEDKFEPCLGDLTRPLY